jgi:hypothetical protein
VLDKYKANVDEAAAPPAIRISQDEDYLLHKVHNSIKASDRTSKPLMTLLRMLKNQQNEIFFRA